MEMLWAPWRMDYILGPKPDECVFCIPTTTDEDEERLVVYRGKTVFVVMNKFPYNAGHLLVVPFRHTWNFCDLTVEESLEITSLSQLSVRVLEKASSPQGFNLGLNLGEAAGAGIKAHVHFHIVPRWNGDSSFMAALGEVRTLPEHLAVTYAKLKLLFDDLAHS